MKRIALALILSFTTPAFADEWKTTDKVLFGAFIGLQVIDTLQTYEIRKHPDEWKETNPLYGSPPNMSKVIAVKALYTGLVYYLLDTQTSSEGRTRALLVLDAVAAAVVIHNHGIGIRIQF